FLILYHVYQIIYGQFVYSNTSEWIDITDPATKEFIAKVPQTTDDEINQAVAAARKAFQTWRKTPITTRARIFLKYQELIREHMRSEEHTSELQSRFDLVCRLLLEKKKRSRSTQDNGS